MGCGVGIYLPGDTGYASPAGAELLVLCGQLLGPVRSVAYDIRLKHRQCTGKIATVALAIVCFEERERVFYVCARRLPVGWRRRIGSLLRCDTTKFLGIAR